MKQQWTDEIKNIFTKICPKSSGLLKTGLAYALQNNNASGLKALQNAGNQISSLYQPYLTSGTNANQQLANLSGANGNAAAQAAMANFQNSPGYQFALQQGLNALDASAAARGQLVSGNQQRAVQTYGQGLANQDYQNYLNNLNSVSNTGLNAGQGVATGLSNAASAQAQLGANQANTQNAAIGSLANYLFPTTTNIPNWLSSLLGSSNNTGLLSYL